MKVWPWLGLITLCLINAPALASKPTNLQPKAGRYTVVGILTMGEDMMAKLLLNPASSNRISMPVENPKSVAKWLKTRSHSGLVRVELEVGAVAGETRPVRILKITPVRARRVPLYDEKLTAVARGNG